MKEGYIKRKTSTIPFGYETSEVNGYFKPIPEQINAVEGMPMHLTHIQYHSYNNEGDKKFSSGASFLAEKINSKSLKPFSAACGFIINLFETDTKNVDSDAEPNGIGFIDGMFIPNGLLSGGGN